MTIETKEFAQLAARVYATTFANKLEAPLGWETLEIIPDLSDGFSAGVFRRIGSDEIVIAYTGTNASKIADTAFGNLPAATGQPSSQVLKAMLLYERVKNTPGYGDNISFTGHSLGGGLASLMAVYFNKSATTFDAAPFQLSALNSSTLNYYKNELASRGYADANFNQYNDASYPLPPTAFATREGKVTGFHLQGEFLNITRSSLTTIYGGVENEVKTGPTALSAFLLHSMTLLSATQWSTSFATAIQANSMVLNLVFDRNLYFKDDETDPQANFLNQALSSEVKASGVSSQGMLSHFGADLNKLGTNLAGLNDAAQKAIIAQGIEWYYWQGTNYAGQEFFTKNGDLLQYTTALGEGLSGAKDRASEYTRLWLNAAYTESSGDTRFAPMGTAFDQWNVAQSSTGVTATARDTKKSQIFLGGTGADSFTGGGKDDVIFAGGGDDTVDGGAGDDLIYGGKGNDRYNFNAKFGSDTVLDADGSGSLWVDGVQLKGGKKLQDNVWESLDHHYRYSVLAGNLIIVRGSEADASTMQGSITVKGWTTSASLGINLDNATFDKPADIKVFKGDQRAKLIGVETQLSVMPSQSTFNIFGRKEVRKRYTYRTYQKLLLEQAFHGCGRWRRTQLTRPNSQRWQSNTASRESVS